MGLNQKMKRDKNMMIDYFSIIIAFVGGFFLARFLKGKKFHVVKFEQKPLKNKNGNNEEDKFYIKITLEHTNEIPSWASEPEIIGNVAVQKFENFAVFDRFKKIERQNEHLKREITDVSKLKIRTILRQL